MHFIQFHNIHNQQEKLMFFLIIKSIKPLKIMAFFFFKNAIIH